MKEMYSIQRVAEMFDITTNKIRFYEKKGLLRPLRDEENQYRLFSDEDLIRLQTIILYRVLGLSIEDIKSIFNDEDKENYLNHFHRQWQIVNDEVHRLVEVRHSLEKIIDRLYESTQLNSKEDVLEVINKTNDLYKTKNQWKDKWNFDGWAKTYDKYVQANVGRIKIYQNYNKILNEVYCLATKESNESINVLEIGVGTGNLASKFLHANYDIVGIDQSREMLNVAKEKYPKLKVRLGEFLKIPFENKIFDVIVSTYAFHHLQNHEKVVAINEMLRVLKDNGKIIIGDLMFKDEVEKAKILKGLTKEKVEEIEDEYYSNIDFLEKEFEKCGKSIIYKQIDQLNYIIDIS